MNYDKFDYREENPNESWDQFIVRKMVEKRKMNDHEEKSQAAFDALIGKRDDIYPCREDVPAELWGEPIPSKKRKMIIIAGPCQIESKEQGFKIANHCAEICDKYGFDYYFKASFDKANRTNISGQRGLGLKDGIDAIFKVSEQVKVKTCVDFHDVEQIRFCEDWGWLPDIIQIPAFLCRQTDLLKAAVETGRTVNIKKGQFLAPWDVAGILSKTGTDNVMITERGTSFGYNTLVVDYTGIQYMLDTFDVPIVFDATHSVQKPGGLGASSGGNRVYVPGLARAAAAVGVKNFFMEVHEDPDNAPSDGPNMLRLEDFENVVKEIEYHVNG